MLTDDFAAYWSAARVLAAGGNPYDPAALLAVLQPLGWPHEVALPVWYGPWIVAAALPIGWLPYGPARAAWLIVQVASLAAAAVLLWRRYGGMAGDRRAFALVATFAPSFLCLVEGQITPLCLLGLALFLAFERRRSDWLAGAALFPLTAKPLALYLVFLAVGGWALRTRRLAVLAGLGLAVAAGSLAALAAHPAVIGEWIRFSAAHPPLVQNYTPTFGTILRSVFGADRLWLAYALVPVGLAWFGARARRFGSDLDWSRAAPELLFASLLTAPFAWAHDALLLFPAVIQVAVARWAGTDRAFWLVLNASAAGLYPLLRYDQVGYLLVPIALAVWWKNGGLRASR